MKTPGLFYVDAEGGYLRWCGLFRDTKNDPSVYGIGFSEIWLWSIIDGKYLVNYKHTNNYYNRREATTEEVGKIAKLYETLRSKIYTTIYFLLDQTGIPVYVSLSEEKATKKMEGTEYKLKKKELKINEL